MMTSVATVSAMIDDSTVQAVVSDLDGVLRRFDPVIWTQLGKALDLPPRTVYSAILGHEHLQEVVRGRSTHEEWRRIAREALIGHGAEPQAAADAVATWAGAPARVDPEVRGLLQAARRRGLAVIVLTNGTDRVRDEIEELGLTDIIGEDARFLLSSHQIGTAKPEPEVFRAAHQRLEEIAGRSLEPDRVVLLDDSPRNVRAAEDFGWRSVHHPSDG